MTSTPVVDFTTKLFGEKVTIPSNYIFPVVAREFPDFNNPYLELTHQLYKHKKRKLNIIDIGASVGDTFLFIYKNLPESVNKIICIEGYSYFYKYLELNTKKNAVASPVLAVLSDKEETINELIQTHESTASALGENSKKAQPLDKLLSGLAPAWVDIIKIDVDGYDGKVLNGARNILLKYSPHVIFEYHPILLCKTKNDLLLPFSVLKECGYTKLLWFDKFGLFSHSCNTQDKSVLIKYATNCLEEKPEADRHYDIIALPENSELDTEIIRECKFSRNKKFFY